MVAVRLTSGLEHGDGQEGRDEQRIPADASVGRHAEPVTIGQPVLDARAPAHRPQPRDDARLVEARPSARLANRLRAEERDVAGEVQRAPVAPEELEVPAVDVGGLAEERAARLEQLPGAPKRGQRVPHVLDHMPHANEVEGAGLEVRVHEIALAHVEALRGGPARGLHVELEPAHLPLSGPCQRDEGTARPAADVQHLTGGPDEPRHPPRVEPVGDAEEPADHGVVTVDGIARRIEGGNLGGGGARRLVVEIAGGAAHEPPGARHRVLVVACLEHRHRVAVGAAEVADRAGELAAGHRRAHAALRARAGASHSARIFRTTKPR